MRTSLTTPYQYRLQSLGEHQFADPECYDETKTLRHLCCVKCGLKAIKVRLSDGRLVLYANSKLTCMEGQIKDIIE